MQVRELSLAAKEFDEMINHINFQILLSEGTGEVNEGLRIVIRNTQRKTIIILGQSFRV